MYIKSIGRFALGALGFLWVLGFAGCSTTNPFEKISNRFSNTLNAGVVTTTAASSSPNPQQEMIARAKANDEFELKCSEFEASKLQYVFDPNDATT